MVISLAVIIDSVVYYLGCLLGVIIFLIWNKLINQKRFEMKIKNLVLVAIIAEVLVIDASASNVLIKFGAFAFHTWLYCILYKERYLKMFSISGIYYVISIILHVAFGAGLVSLFQIIDLTILPKFIPQLTTVLTGVFFIGTATVKPIQYGINKMIKSLGEEKSDYFFVSIIFCFINLVSINGMEFVNSLTEMSFLIFSSLVLFFILVYLLYIKNEKKLLAIKNQELNTKNDLYNATVDNYQKLKENMISNLLVIRDISNHKTKDLIDHYIENTYKIKDQNLTQIDLAPDGLKEIILQKVIPTKSEITLIVNNHLDSEVIRHMKPSTYCSMSNLFAEALDKIIENTLINRSKIIKIEILKNTERLIIKLSSESSNFNPDQIKRYQAIKNPKKRFRSLLKNQNIKIKSQIIKKDFLITMTINLT